jgi:ABC-type maltose transport system permease subunit
MAGSMVGALPPLVLYLLLQSYLVEGLTAGAVKE